MIQFLLTLLVGGFAGVMTGFMGASGVMAVVPGMILMGYTTHQAIGTSLAVDMTASIVVALTYYQNGRVNMRQGLWIALAAIVGAQLGSRLSGYVPELGLSSGFGVVLLLSGILFWRSGLNRSFEKIHNSTIASRLKSHPVALSVGIGLYAGIYCGLFGAGGGMLFLIVLLMLGYSLHQAVGTSTMIMALTTASGTVGYAALGNVPYLTVVGITGGTVMGSFASARLANRLNERFLGRAIAVVFTLLGIAVLLTTLF